MSPPRIAYLIPEFPGQTHTWIWRELEALRGWEADIWLLSTQAPPARDRARHAFAAASGQTYYLYRPVPRTLAALLGSLLRRSVLQPAAVLRAFRLAASLPIEGGRGFRRCVPLLAPAARLVDYCRQRGITHVHCHTCGDGLILALLARTMGGPTYSTCINANLDWWGGAMEEKLRDATFSVSTMRWVKEDVDRRYSPSVAARCHYAPVGVDTQAWRPLPRPDAAPGAPLDLLCVGRLHPSKGFDIALHALKQVGEAGTAARLTFLGDGPERATLEALAASLGVADQVRFAGSVAEDEVRRTLALADIFLLPSHAEPLGVVVMEAMAMETPVIATAAGGVTEIVTSGIDGLLVPPRDPDALARAILELARDPSRRRELAQAGRQAIIERFDAKVGARTVYGLLFGAAPEAAPAPPPLGQR